MATLFVGQDKVSFIRSYCFPFKDWGLGGRLTKDSAINNNHGFMLRSSHTGVWHGVNQPDVRASLRSATSGVVERTMCTNLQVLSCYPKLALEDPISASAIQGYSTTARLFNITTFPIRRGSRSPLRTDISQELLIYIQCWYLHSPLDMETLLLNRHGHIVDWAEALFAPHPNGSSTCRVPSTPPHYILLISARLHSAVILS